MSVEAYGIRFALPTRNRKSLGRFGDLCSMNLGAGVCILSPILKQPWVAQASRLQVARPSGFFRVSITSTASLRLYYNLITSLRIIMYRLECILTVFDSKINNFVVFSL